MDNNKETIKTRGGARPNSGRKSKWDEKTKVFQTRIPESKYENIKKAVNILLTEDYLERFLYEFENH